MVNHFLFATVIGTVLGFLSGLGIGGGSLLILWLTFVAGMTQQDARMINLMFFIPSALVACLFRWRQGHLQIKKVLPAMVAGSISAAIFAMVGNNMDTFLLKKLFGGLLIVIGIRELSVKRDE